MMRCLLFCLLLLVFCKSNIESSHLTIRVPISEDTFEDIIKTDNTSCKIQVLCKENLLNESSSFDIAEHSVCSYSDPSNTNFTILVGRNATIEIENLVEDGDSFKALVTEIPNSCSSNKTGGGGSKNKTHDCLATLSSSSGFISSPGYPNPYKSKTNCKYYFTPESGYCGVQLYFDHFKLEKSVGCEYDYLQINEAKFCGDKLFSRKIRVEFPLFVALHSDGTINNKGFFSSYQYLEDCENVCNELLSKKNGYILPPLASSGNYSNDRYCRYDFIPVKGVKCFEFKFKNLHLQDGDYVKVNDHKFSNKMPSGAIYQTIPYGGKMPHVEFYSDEKGNYGTGFKLRYSQVTNTKLCPKPKCQPTVIDEKSYTLESPNYPQLYPKNYVCYYEITPFNGTKGIDIVLLADLPEGDSLTVTEGETKSPNIYQLFHAKTVKFPKDGQKSIIIEFKSNGLVEATYKMLIIQEYEVMPTVIGA